MADSVTYIKNEAFASCRNLRSIRLSLNVRNIEGDAFYACERLEHLTLPDTLKLWDHLGHVQN